jgi:hypothetical protein
VNWEKVFFAFVSCLVLAACFALFLLVKQDRHEAPYRARCARAGGEVVQADDSTLGCVRFSQYPKDSLPVGVLRD